MWITIICIVFCLAWVLIIIFNDEADRIDRAIYCFLLVFTTLLLFVQVFINPMKELGAKHHIQHPKDFKIEYKYTLQDTLLVPTDTIVTLKN